MMYMMTADQHAQIVEALDAAENYMTSLRKPQVQAALFMVEAMRPVEPIQNEALRDAAQEALACMRGLQQHLGYAVCDVEAANLYTALKAMEANNASQMD